MNYRLLVVFQPVSRSQASKIVDEFRPMLIYTDIPIILLKENKSRLNLDFVYNCKCMAKAKRSNVRTPCFV